MHNLFISYELADELKNGDLAKRACQSLGNSTNLLKGCWYINSPYNADDAIKRIGGAFGPEDKLVVANTFSDSCTWLGLSETEAQRIRQNWKMKLRSPEERMKERKDAEDGEAELPENTDDNSQPTLN